MIEKVLILLVGLPRSGKSTWAINSGFPIINRDAIRLALHGKPYIQEAEGIITPIEELMVKSLFLAGHDTVIVDATHTTEKRRHRWKYGNWNIYIKKFPVTLGVCIERAKDSNREDLIPVIERMSEQIDFESEYPDYEG